MAVRLIINYDARLAMCIDDKSAEEMFVKLEIWNECARLMSNCMIYYNAKILNALLLKFQKESNEHLIEQLKYISPVVWIDINLYGYYMFEEELGVQNMTDIVETINMLKSA